MNYEADSLIDVFVSVIDYGDNYGADTFALSFVLRNVNEAPSGLVLDVAVRFAVPSRPVVVPVL